MRTKTLLLAAAALSAGALAASAQVYSANVVGYVNTVLKPGFNLIVNPLNASPTNALNTLMPLDGDAHDGSFILRWSNALQDYSADQPGYTGAGATGTWGPNSIINPGEGFFFFNSGAEITNTFVGDVVQGASLSMNLGSGFNLIGSIPPIAGTLPTVLTNLAPADGSFVNKWNTTIQDLGDQAGWTETAPGVGYWDPATMQISVGEGVFFFNAGSPIVWTRSFTVN
jgi:hypothetical protein